MKAQLQFSNVLNQVSGLLPVRGIGLFLLLGLSMLATSALARGSELNLSTWDNGGFEVEFDNQHFFADCNFNLTDVRPGRYRLKVFRQGHNPYGHGGGRLSVLYDGFVDIPNRSRVDARVNRNRNLRILNITHLANAYTSCGNNQGYGNQGCGNNGYGNGFNNGYGTCGGGMGFNDAPMCMSNREFQNILCRVRDACFDDDRLRIAKQAVRNQWLDSDQIMRITRQFSFESNKLAFAKFAYHRAIDPHRYYVVNDAFCFSSSVRQLDNYINGCQRY